MRWQIWGVLNLVITPQRKGIMTKRQCHLPFPFLPFSSQLFKPCIVLCTHLCSSTGNYTGEPIPRPNTQTVWFRSAGTENKHMPLLQAVPLRHDYQQTWFWRSLLPSDTHSPPWQFAWLCSKPEAKKEIMLFGKKNPNKQQTISRFKIREQPRKHMRRHRFPGKA